jgi:glycerol-3-phosphate dehydrogenase
MGRCQGGFCSPRVVEILAEELHKPMTSICKGGPGSELLVGTIQEAMGKEAAGV